MDLSIQKLNKTFNQKVIFRDLSFDIKSGSRFAITGANGAGKSTLLKIISGGALASSGRISYSLNGKMISEDKLYQHVHFAAPYNTVIEELTLRELFDLHQRLGLLNNFSSFDNWFEKLEYSFQPGQQIKMFSSGMKQRIKLAIALLDTRNLILLDEPGSNLDMQGKAWMYSLINTLNSDQTLVIATNDRQEVDHCGERVELMNQDESFSSRSLSLE